MRRILTIAAFLFVGASFAFGQAERRQVTPSGNQQSDVAQQLIDLEKRWSAAYLKKDMVTLKSIMADDILIVYGDGSRGTKAEDLASIGADEQIESNVLDDFRVRINGDMAVVMSRLTSKGVRKGKAFNAQFRYIDVFERRDGRWQCVVTQNTHIGDVDF